MVRLLVRWVSQEVDGRVLLQPSKIETLPPLAEWNGLVVQLHARDRQELAHLLTRATRCRSAGGGDAREREWVNPDIVDLSVGSRHPCRLELRLPGNELFRARVVRVVRWRLAESGNYPVDKCSMPG